jgi:YHS domain-containing protein
MISRANLKLRSEAMRLTSIIAVLVAFAVITGVALAEETAKRDSTAKAQVVELTNQTNCPVMGGKIDSTAYTDIQGQRVYHCCPMCSKKLTADPDKYFKQAAANGVLFENIQTFCPVSGKELEQKEVYTDYEGRRVYFCCENCIPIFEKDPQKYLSILDQPEPPENKADMSGMKMDQNSEEQDR